jgi:Phosphoesterase family
MPQTIQHLVVLMLENRSFDHMLGYLRSPGYAIDGLTGDEWNPRDPAHIDPTQEVKVSNDAGFILSYDPGHEFQRCKFATIRHSGRSTCDIAAERGLHYQLLAATSCHPGHSRHDHEVYGTNHCAGSRKISARVRSVRCLVFIGSWADVAEPILCTRGHVRRPKPFWMLLHWISPGPIRLRLLLQTHSPVFKRQRPKLLPT